jgi:hypothetical protein
MVERIKNLRHPIHAEINGHPCVMLTIGHLAHAVGRSNWTIKHWTKLGLLPAAPFLQRPNVSNTRRRLYPEPFVKCLAEIAAREYVGDRLERAEWERFREDVNAAFQTTVVPLLGLGVTRTASDVVDKTRDAMPESLAVLVRR